MLNKLTEKLHSVKAAKIEIIKSMNEKILKIETERNHYKKKSESLAYDNERLRKKVDNKLNSNDGCRQTA